MVPPTKLAGLFSPSAAPGTQPIFAKLSFSGVPASDFAKLGGKPDDMKLLITFFRNAITKSIEIANPDSKGSGVNILSFKDLVLNIEFYTHSTVGSARRLNDVAIPSPSNSPKAQGKATIEVDFVVLLLAAFKNPAAVAALLNDPSSKFLDDISKQLVIESASYPQFAMLQNLAFQRGIYPAAASPSKTDNTGAIVGGVIGGIVALTLAIGAYMYYSKHMRSGPAVVPAEADMKAPAGDSA